MVYRMGFGRDLAALGVAVPDQRDLRWQSVAGGRAVTLALVSPGARALRARLRFSALPAGTEARVYAPSSGGAVTGWVSLPDPSE